MYAGVYILDAKYHMDKRYDYFIPENLTADVKTGCFVMVPFGGGNKKRTGIVFEIKETSDVDIKKTKPIDSILNRNIFLNAEQIALAYFLKETTFCTISDAVKAMLPAGMRQDVYYSYRIADRNIFASSKIKDLNEKNLLILNFLSYDTKPLKELEEEFGSEVKYVLASLKKLGFIEEEASASNAIGGKFEKIASLSNIFENVTEYNDKIKGLSRQGESVIEYLQSNGDCEIGELTEYLDITSSVLKTLEKKSLIEIYERPLNRDNYANLTADMLPAESGELTAEQNGAYERLAELYRTKTPCAALLHGVTGSGKTFVLMNLIRDVADSGRSVIYLVPEISLIPQVYALFEKIYGERVKIIHSALSKGERFDTLSRIYKNEVDIIIGTRSAVFAPFTNLGLIVIDEEHEHTYKSEQKPHYHAREAARFRCAKNNAMMVLSSATPLVESYYKAVTGRYELISLKSRYGESHLPEIEFVDMRFDNPENKILLLSSRLIEEMAANIAQNEQTILYQNRRGYNNFLSCRSCGEAVMCPHCSITLKLHAGKYAANNARRTPSNLICHYCGYNIAVPKECPSCGSEHMLAIGTGTQKCEDDIKQMFPDVKVARMDADTTVRKHSHNDIIKRVQNNDVDILIGTQMVTKGHNFRNVTLVGVLSADQTLHMDDYRAIERTFALISQVTGRAGRADKGGRAIIQTWNKDNEIFNIAVSNNYELMYEKEIRLRKSALFPPFCDVCVLNVTSVDEPQVSLVSKQILLEMRNMLQNDYKDITLEIFGPFPAIIYKVNNTFRMRLILKCMLNSRTKHMLAALLIAVSRKLPPKININIDVNPNSI